MCFTAANDSHMQISLFVHVLVIVCCQTTTGNGGAMLTAGTMLLVACNITSNSGFNGGAIYTDYGAVTVFEECIVTNNTAQQSG
jgi:predicted outer membrane repeat protein